MASDRKKSLFQPAKTPSASEAIYNQIYPKIVSGELRPGDRLPPERELAEMFQRSRPVVREALRMLQQDGLLETTRGTNGGAIVRGVSLNSVGQRFIIRRRTRMPCAAPWRVPEPTWIIA